MVGGKARDDPARRPQKDECRRDGSTQQGADARRDHGHGMHHGVALAGARAAPQERAGAARHRACIAARGRGQKKNALAVPDRTCVFQPLPARRRMGDRQPCRAVESHVALSVPDFPDVSRRPLRLAGTRQRGDADPVRRLAGARRRSDRARGPCRHDAGARRPADLGRGAGAVFFGQRGRGDPHRAQPRLRCDRDAAMVGAAAAFDRLCADSARSRCSLRRSCSCWGR